MAEIEKPVLRPITYTNLDYGTFVVGRITMFSEVEEKKGVTSTGRSWSFFQQTCYCSLAKTTVEIVSRSDTRESIFQRMYKIEEIVRIPVANPKDYKGKVVYDLDLV